MDSFRLRTPLVGLAVAVLLTALVMGCEKDPSNKSSTSYPSQSILTITANPTSMPGNGTSSGTITVYLTNGQGDPVASAVVNLSTTGGTFTGTGANGTSATVTTGSTGYATIFLTSAATVETVKVVATYENVSATATVNFI